MNAVGGRFSGSWLGARPPRLLPRVPATPALGSGRLPSATTHRAQGPEGMVNRQYTTSWRAPRMLSAEQQEELRVALAGPAPEGGKRWRACDVANWMAVRLEDRKS